MGRGEEGDRAEFRLFSVLLLWSVPPLLPVQLELQLIVFF